jgi:hypothetical protein
MGKIIVLLIMLALVFEAGYINGRQDGHLAGRNEALAEAAMVKSEDDLAMQKAGLCKWSRLMATDARCATELP